MDLADIHRTFLTAPKYTFFSSEYAKFPRTDQILCHNAHLNKFLKMEIILVIPSDHKAIKLVIDNKNNFGNVQIQRN
jgi:hypothetical protein